MQTINKNLEKKNVAAKEKRKTFSKTKTIVLFHNLKLDVASFQELRRNFKKEGAELRVFKNTFLNCVFKGTQFEDVNVLLKGPVVCGFSEDLNINLFKLIFKEMKRAEKIQLIGGWFEEKFLDEKAAKELAMLPSRAELLGGLVNILQSPLATVLNLMGVLAKKKKK